MRNVPANIRERFECVRPVSLFYGRSYWGMREVDGHKVMRLEAAAVVVRRLSKSSDIEKPRVRLDSKPHFPSFSSGYDTTPLPSLILSCASFILNWVARLPLMQNYEVAVEFGNSKRI